MLCSKNLLPFLPSFSFNVLKSGPKKTIYSYSSFIWTQKKCASNWSSSSSSSNNCFSRLPNFTLISYSSNPWILRHPTRWSVIFYMNKSPPIVFAPSISIRHFVSSSSFSSSYTSSSSSSFFCYLKSFSALTLTFLGGSLLLIYLHHPENHLSSIVAKGLLYLDPEIAHTYAIQCLRWTPWLLPKIHPTLSHHPSLTVPFLGFSNPIGLAAGFDKHGQAIQGLSQLGFGFLEVGSVTPLPQEGNPRPRVFRLPESLAVINRYGFNSFGHAYTLAQLLPFSFTNTKSSSSFSSSSSSSSSSLVFNPTLPPIGINLGRNKWSTMQDYLEGIRTFASFSNYLVINVSSPNTPGLRDMLTNFNQLNAWISKCTHLNHQLNGPPLFIKLCADGFQEQELTHLAQLLKQYPIAGVIMGNTTVERPDDLKGDPSIIHQHGGLSGAPLKKINLQAVRILYREFQSSIPIIGCGGIMNAQDILEYGKAGAHAVQVYTGLIYHGPSFVHHLLTDLVQLLEKEGKQWHEIIGQDHRT